MQCFMRLLPPQGAVASSADQQVPGSNPGVPLWST